MFHVYDIYLEFCWRKKSKSSVCWSKDCDWIWSRESLHQPSSSDSCDQGGEGRVDRQRVKDRAGQTARPRRDLELERGRSSGAGREERAGGSSETEGGSERTEGKLRIGIREGRGDTSCNH